MKILFLDQAMNRWFADWYPRCELPNGIVGTKFIFLRTSKLLKNGRIFFCCCGNESATSFSTQFPWFFLLSYELPCGNIQNSDTPSRFYMRSNLFHQNHFQWQPFACRLKPSSCVCLNWWFKKRPSQNR